MPGGGCEEALGCGTAGAGTRGVFRPSKRKGRVLVMVVVDWAQAYCKRSKQQSPTLLNVVLGNRWGTGFGAVDKWLSTHILVCSPGPIPCGCVLVRDWRGVWTSDWGRVSSLRRVSVVRVDLSTRLLDGLSWVFGGIIIPGWDGWRVACVGCRRRRENVAGRIVVLLGLGNPGGWSSEGRRAYGRIRLLRWVIVISTFLFSFLT